MQGSVDTSPLLRAQLVDDGRPERACSLDLRPCCRNGVFEYVERDPVTCEFPTCEADRRSCRNLGPTCIRAGCNGELCVSADEAIPPANSCDFSQNAACFDAATCEWTGTACDWRMTSELRECLADNANSPCPSDQSCVDRPSCIADGGTPGSVCGAGDTKVCCASDDTPDLEECDDGNRVDDDACGNDCRVNCSINADCPEGACVDGECVDQCAAPAQPMAMHESADTVERAVEFLPRLMARGDFSLLP